MSTPIKFFIGDTQPTAATLPNNGIYFNKQNKLIHVNTNGNIITWDGNNTDTDTNTTYDLVSEQEDGLMRKQDYIKLLSLPTVRYGDTTSPYGIGLEKNSLYFSASTTNYVSWVEKDGTIHTVHSGTGWSRENNACVLNHHLNTAAGYCSIALNQGTEARGSGSVAMNNSSKCLSDYSIASGVDTVNESPRSFVGGWLSHNYPSAVHSFNFGYRNNCYGKNTAIFGTDNTSYDGSDHAFVCGNECKVYGTESLSGGYQSIANGSKSVAVGSQCVALQAGSVALGERAVATGIGAIAIGASSGYPRTSIDVLLADKSSVEQIEDTIINEHNGEVTLASGNYSVALGYNNHAAGTASFAAGQNCTAGHAHCVALGFQNYTTRDNQLICGQYADNTEDAEALFVVGTGSSYNNRANGFSVTASGIKIGSATLTAAHVTALLDQLNKYQIVKSLDEATTAEGTIAIVTG